MFWFAILLYFGILALGLFLYKIDIYVTKKRKGRKVIQDIQRRGESDNDEKRG